MTYWILRLRLHWGVWKKRRRVMTLSFRCKATEGLFSHFGRRLFCPKNLRWTTVPWSTRTTTSFLQMKWRDLFIQILRNFASFCLSYKVTTPWKARYILQFIDKIIGWGEGDMENVELPREGYVSGGALAELPICRFFFWWKVPSPSPTPPSKLEAGVSVWFCGHLLFDGFPGHVAKRRSCFRWDDVKKDLWLKNWVPNLWTK